MAQTVRNPLALQGTWVQSLDQIVFPFSLWRRSTLVFLPGEFHGQRSLVSYSPWDPKESDMAEQLTLFFFKTLQNCISFAKYQHESATGLHVDRHFFQNRLTEAYCILKTYKVFKKIRNWE